MIEKKLKQEALKAKFYKTLTYILVPAAFAGGIYIGIKVR